MKRAWPLALATAIGVGLGFVACGGPREVRSVSMRLGGTPANASVTVDDVFIGSLAFVAAHGVALPVGSHRVTVEAPGYLPWDRMIEAKEGQGPVRLDVHLVATPD